MDNCPLCGAEIKDGAKVRKNCGGDIAAFYGQKDEAERKAKEAADAYSEQRKQEHRKAAAAKTKKIVLNVILVILCVVFGLAGLWGAYDQSPEFRSLFWRYSGYEQGDLAGILPLPATIVALIFGIIVAVDGNSKMLHKILGLLAVAAVAVGCTIWHPVYGILAGIALFVIGAFIK